LLLHTGGGERSVKDVTARGKLGLRAGQGGFKRSE
jgi:hypothetical protein